MRRLLSVLAVILAVVTTMPAYAQTESLKNPPIKGDMYKLRTLDKSFKLPSALISSVDNGLTNLSEFKGKLIVLNIWATWCPPCVTEMPSLNALQYAMGGDKFKVVAVSIDKDGLQVAKKYMTDNNLTGLTPYFDVNNDIQQLEVLKGVPGVPVSLIIDPQGNVLSLVEGDVDWNGPDARAVLDYYMKNIPSFSAY